MRELVFELAAVEDLAWWVEHQLAGCWSRRIDQEHRLVYQVEADKIRVLACRYHY